MINLKDDAFQKVTFILVRQIVTSRMSQILYQNWSQIGRKWPKKTAKKIFSEK